MRPLLASLLLVALLLPGCAEKPVAEKPAVAAAPVVVTSLDDAASLSNSTFMNASHEHDYWGGKTELSVLDRVDTVGYMTVGGGSVARDFLPAGGHVVPQGTDRVTVSVSWSPDATSHFGSLELWVKRPNDFQPLRVGALVSGKPVVLATTLADADVPHQQLSAWVFEVRILPGVDPILVFEGDIALKVVAHRGLPIPLFPPHPDLWRGKETVALLDEDVPLAVWDGSAPDDYRCYVECPRVHRPVNGTVVPYDAAFVEVTLTKNDPSVDTLGLKFHGGDTRNFTKIPPTTEQGNVRTYRIAVKNLMGDGPYASQSLWEFIPYVESPKEDGYHVGAYHITARALRH